MKTSSPSSSSKLLLHVRKVLLHLHLKNLISIICFLPRASMNTNEGLDFVDFDSKCLCGRRAMRFTSWMESNPGRRFWGCSNYRVESELKFVFVAQVEFAHVDYDLKLVLVAHLNLVLVAQVKSLHHLHSQLQTLLHLFHHFSHKLTCCALPAHICCT
ncbi:hypothetical protein Q3G72_011869 [Acer saccharum]|nr:hypothetical protein Q3G72_011869 [Acer saccharum]